MNGQKQVLVRRRANDIRNAPVFETKEGRVPEVQRAGDLQGHDGEDNPFGEGLVAAELGDLWVRLDDGDAARAVRLLGVCPEEVGGVGGGGIDGLGGLLGGG